MSSPNSWGGVSIWRSWGSLLACCAQALWWRSSGVSRHWLKQQARHETTQSQHYVTIWLTSERQRQQEAAARRTQCVMEPSYRARLLGVDELQLDVDDDAYPDFI